MGWSGALRHVSLAGQVRPEARQALMDKEEAYSVPQRLQLVTANLGVKLEHVLSDSSAIATW